jgi:hypothetical protein
MSEEEGVAEARRSWAEAAAAVERKDMRAAHDAYRRAVELLNEHGTRQERVRCHREWVEALRSHGEDEQALEAFQLASQLALERQDR